MRDNIRYAMGETSAPGLTREHSVLAVLWLNIDNTCSCRLVLAVNG